MEQTGRGQEGTTETIRTQSGQRLYVAWGIPQIDGGYRYICTQTEQEARRVERILTRDETMVDHLGADVIVVDA